MNALKTLLGVLRGLLGAAEQYRIVMKAHETNNIAAFEDHPLVEGDWLFGRDAEPRPLLDVEDRRATVECCAEEVVYII